MSSQQKKLLSVALALFALAIFFGFATDGIFWEARNLSNLLRQTSITGILVVGMTAVLILGAVDLSVGSMVALCGVVIGVAQTQWGWGAESWMGVFKTVSVTMLVGTLLGLFNGLWIAGAGIHSFVITFGMMVIARGLAMIVSGGRNLAPMSSELNLLGAGYLSPFGSLIVLILLILPLLVFLFKKSSQSISALVGILCLSGLIYVSQSYNGLPYPLLLCGILALLGAFFLKHTRAGIYTYAAGDSLAAATLSGLPVKKITLGVFVLMGFLASLASLVLTARLNGASPNAGQLLELDAIAACVIGGTSLKGGRGTILGSLLGAILISTLNNGMSLMNVDSFYQMPLKGLIVILAVAFDALLEKRKGV